MAQMNSVETDKHFANSVLSKIGEKRFGRTMTCQLCGESDSWFVDSKPAFVLSWDVSQGVGSMFVGSQRQGFPLVLVVCKNCGNTLFVNAVMLGAGDPTKLRQHG